MYKEDLALNNPEWLKCHKTQPNEIDQFIYLFLVSYFSGNG